MSSISHAADILIKESAEVRRRCQRLFEESRQLRMHVANMRPLLAQMRGDAKAFSEHIYVAHATSKRGGNRR
jgi:hypothetical protein